MTAKKLITSAVMAILSVLTGCASTTGAGQMAGGTVSTTINLATGEALQGPGLSLHCTPHTEDWSWSSDPRFVSVQSACRIDDGGKQYVIEARVDKGTQAFALRPDVLSAKKQ